MAVAGTAIWLPRRVRDRLRDEVEENGLKVVSFGAETLRRTVALVDDRLRDPSPPRPDDLFGERTEVFRSDPAAPLAPQRDGLGLFEDVDELFGEFSVFERSVSLPPTPSLLTAAGREEGEPRLRGLLARQGRGDPARNPAVGRASWRRAG